MSRCSPSFSCLCEELHWIGSRGFAMQEISAPSQAPDLRARIVVNVILGGRIPPLLGLLFDEMAKRGQSHFHHVESLQRVDCVACRQLVGVAHQVTVLGSWVLPGGARIQTHPPLRQGFSDLAAFINFPKIETVCIYSIIF